MSATAEVLQLVPTAETSAQKARLEILSKDLKQMLSQFERNLQELPGAMRGSKEQDEEMNQIRQMTINTSAMLERVCALHE